MSVQIIVGDALEVLRTLPDRSVHMCCTSPPYWGLRDYGVASAYGLEPTIAEYIAKMVAVFAEVKRVLRDDGTLWLNMGDSYHTGAGSGFSAGGRGASSALQVTNKGSYIAGPNRLPQFGLKPKDLCGIPWRLTFALQQDGWYLRSDIIWHKPNPMPESVMDRPTKSHEYIFLLSKREKYYYNAEAIKETCSDGTHERYAAAKGGMSNWARGEGPRNKRTVWAVPTHSFKEAHFATFPPKLIEPCILAGCPIGGIVLDCFGGAGTTGLVADRLQRSAILIELNPAYAEMARKRIDGDAPMFADISTSPSETSQQAELLA